jgi:hypothetical protein
MAYRARSHRRALGLMACFALLVSCGIGAPAGPITRAFKEARADNNHAEVDAVAQVERVILRGALAADVRRQLRREGFKLSDLKSNSSYVPPGGSGLLASKTVERAIIMAGEYRVIVGFDRNGRVEYVWAKYFFHAP